MEKTKPNNPGNLGPGAAEKQEETERRAAGTQKPLSAEDIRNISRLFEADPNKEFVEDAERGLKISREQWQASIDHAQKKIDKEKKINKAMETVASVMEQPLSAKDFAEIGKQFRQYPDKDFVENGSFEISREKWQALRDYAEYLELEKARDEIPDDKITAFNEWVAEMPPNPCPQADLDEWDKKLIDRDLTDVYKLYYKEDGSLYPMISIPAFIAKAEKRKQDREKAELEKSNLKMVTKVMTDKDYEEISSLFENDPNRRSVENKDRGMKISRDQWQAWQDQSPKSNGKVTLEPAKTKIKQNSESTQPKEKSVATNKKTLKKLKARIQELEDAKKTGRLSGEYGHARDYMDKANAEIGKLEKEIADLEKKIKGTSVTNKSNTVAADPSRVRSEDVNTVRLEDPKPLKKDVRSLNDRLMDGPNQMVWPPEGDEEEDQNEVIARPEEAEEEVVVDVKVNTERETYNRSNLDAPETPIVPKTPETPEPTPKPVRKRRRIGIVETDLVEQRSRDLAEARLTVTPEKKAKGVKENLKNLVKGTWIKGTWKAVKHNWTHEYNRQKEILRVKGEINNAGSIYGAADAGGLLDKKTKEAILERFMSDNPEMIHNLADEKFIEDKKMKAAAQISLRSLMIKYASDKKFTDENFVEERNRIFARDLGLDIGDTQSLAVSSELFEMAKVAKDAVRNGEALNNLDLDFELVVGRAKSGTRTEAQLNTVDRLIDKIRSKPYGRFVNETTIAAAYSIVTGLAMTGTRSKLASVATLGGSALLGGAMMGHTENLRLKRERAQMEREDAVGKQFTANNAPQRQELSRFVIDKKNVGDLFGTLDAIYETMPDGTRKVKNLSAAEYQAAVEALAEVESRINLSDEKHKDLIRYSSIEQIESERTRLDVERADVKAKLLKMFDASKVPAGSATFEEYLKKTVQKNADKFMDKKGDLTEKQRLFDKFKNRRVGFTVAKGVVIGGAVGALFQEVSAPFRSGQEGFLEGWYHKLFGGGERNVPQNYTAFNALVRNLAGSADQGTVGMDHHLYNFGPGSGTHYRLPSDVLDIMPNSEGGYDLMDIQDAEHAKVLVHNISVDSAGNFSEETAKALKEAGVVTSSESYSLQTTVTEHTPSTMEVVKRDVVVGDYIGKNEKSFGNVHRVDWADNDTMRPDLNELRLSDPKLVQDGNVRFSVKKMFDGGSVVDGQSFDPAELAKEGKLKLLLSLSEDTQTQPIEITVGENMQVDLNPNDPVLKNIVHVDPVTHHVTCDARYIEVAAVTGVKDGVDQVMVLSTDQGKGIDMLKDMPLVRMQDGVDKVVPVTKNVTITNFDLMRPDTFDLPPIIPVWGRLPLERINDSEKIPLPPVYYGFRSSKKTVEKWNAEMSPRLKENNQAKLNQQEEIKWYFENQGNKDKNYLKEIDGNIESQKLSEIVTPDTKIIVCMPVHGVSEVKNIYETLKLYSKQDAKALEQTSILLNINWREGEQGAELSKNTIAEVTRAQHDFPNLKIGYFTKIWSTEFMSKKKNRIYGSVVKYLNDTALRLVEEKNLKNEVYLLTNDADCRGMSSNYLKDILETKDREKSKDAFLGKIEWGSHKYDEYPGLHVTMRFMQYLDAVRRNKSLQKERYVASSGANFICKAGTFAAVGGYDGELGAGADTDLGRRIRNARLLNTEELVSKSEDYPISYISSAWLDTDPDRALGYYMKGQPVATMWSDFDKNGYVPRTDLLIAEGAKENLESDFDQIASRIEYQINGFIVEWAESDRSIYEKALNYLLPMQNGERLWTNEAAEGRVNFQFTATGRKWLKQQLSIYQKDGLKDIKYKNSRGVRATS